MESISYHPSFSTMFSLSEINAIGIFIELPGYLIPFVITMIFSELNIYILNDFLQNLFLFGFPFFSFLFSFKTHAFYFVLNDISFLVFENLT
jgi:hypothetical protein